MPNTDTAICREWKHSARLMGNAFEFTVVSDEESFAQHCFEIATSEVQRIEKLFSTFRADSRINEINDNAGKRATQVEAEVFELIRRAQKISEITDGAFDLSYGSVDKNLWNFNTSMSALPDAATARESVRLINYRNIIMNNADRSVMLKEPGMRIGFGGIGKGYAADRARIVMEQQGVKSGLVNASGDLNAWGEQANGEPWKIGIVWPDGPKLPFSYLNLSGGAVATSGNYEKYVLIGNEKHSHTINPKTGLPIKGIKSVTIMAPNAELADALATPVTVMGVRAGLALINQLKGIECLIIDDNNRIFTSDNIHLHAA